MFFLILGQNKGNLEGSIGKYSAHCRFNNETYKRGEEFYNGCKEFCTCREDLQVHCDIIDCPQSFGLDLVDPGCVEWDLDPDYIPQPPK